MWLTQEIQFTLEVKKQGQETLQNYWEMHVQMHMKKWIAMFPKH